MARTLILATTIASMAIFATVLDAQGARTTWDGVYTEAQAQRGAELYDLECGSCHGAAGAGGGMAGALTGPAFAANYEGQTLDDLVERNRTTMPVGREAQLSRQQYVDITAYLLDCNKFPQGSEELPAQSMALKEITYVASRPATIHQDETSGTEWIRRLERSDRIPGLRIADVIASLKLKPGDVIADIGAGTGAFTLPFAKAVAPSGRALAVDLWPELLDYIRAKAAKENVRNLQTIAAARDDPRLPKGEVDVAFFHDVFHNVNDRQAYLQVLASSLKPGGRIAIIEQEFDDPIAKKWDRPEDRITREQVQAWMGHVGFDLVAEYDLFQGANNPPAARMPERWFVVYARREAR
jgi:mono/diheme cytochrome c family protein/SAM-dependent methyltransferase